MLINWFRDQDHLDYITGETQLAQLEKTLRFPGLQEAAEALRDNPNPEGYTIKGNKDSMKYHGPDSPWFDQTVAEVWFTTAEAAEAAGFTAAGSGAQNDAADEAASEEPGTDEAPAEETGENA